MDHPPEKERDVVIDIDSCLNLGPGVVNLDILDDQAGKIVSLTVCSMPMVFDDLASSEIKENHPCSTKHLGVVSLDPGKNTKRDSRKSMNAKKPPRPPRGLSLDAADQKLIKEISELAMIKRARIERMKALKKMKAGKTSSPISTSSSGNLIALLFTVLFCFVMVFQGCHPSGISPRNNSDLHIHGSSESIETTHGDSNVVIQQLRNSSMSYAPLTTAGSSGNK